MYGVCTGRFARNGMYTVLRISSSRLLFVDVGFGFVKAPCLLGVSSLAGVFMGVGLVMDAGGCGGCCCCC